MLAIVPNEKQRKGKNTMSLTDRKKKILNIMRGGDRAQYLLTVVTGLAIAAIAVNPASALAQGIPATVWNPAGAFQYDDGKAPSVAVSGNVIVEVHEGN